jgi:hypothetical protein
VAAIDVSFLFDLIWDHTQVAEVNTTGPRRAQCVYETDYSRVYLR